MEDEIDKMTVLEIHNEMHRKKRLDTKIFQKKIYEDILDIYIVYLRIHLQVQIFFLTVTEVYYNMYTKESTEAEAVVQ